MNVEPWITLDLVCPLDHLDLGVVDSALSCAHGHRYPIVDGVPIMLVDGVPQTMELVERSIEQANNEAKESNHFYLDTLGINEEEKRGVLELAASGKRKVDPAVSFLVAATNGMAYRHMIGALEDYPIPQLRLPPGDGRTFLDMGCNWGRWCIAAARQGYRPIGLDPSLGAVMAARRVARDLNVQARYVVGDARFLPLRSSTIDTVFSYSVLQHFSPDNATRAAGQIGRVLKPSGTSLVQMPTKLGIRCLYHQARRRFREPRDFEVRYWTLPSLQTMFESTIGPTTFSVDCFFGIGLQYSDRHLLPPVIATAATASEALRRLSTTLPMLTWVADSVYVSSTKAGAAPAGSAAR